MFHATQPAPESGRRRTRKAANGFTLVEMAIAVLVLGLLLGSILVPLQRQVELGQRNRTQAALDEMREVLLGFALSHGYLPCPAISATNGLEDRTANVCTGGKRQGYVPWTTLGVSKLDAWGNIVLYSVTPAFSSGATAFTLGTAPDMRIQTRDSGGALTNLTNANTVVAVVVSPGRNGNGGTTDQGIARALPTGWPASFPDENTNATGSTIFVSRTVQEQGATATGGEFDDQLAWVPAVTLFNRLVTAKILP